METLSEVVNRMSEEEIKKADKEQLNRIEAMLKELMPRNSHWNKP